MDLILEGFRQAFGLIARGDPALYEIVARSLAVSLSATFLAALAGIPAGAALVLRAFPGRGLLEVLVNTGMALPPVVVGLVVTILLWRTGPLGALTLLYTPQAMVAAQFLVAMPIAAGLTRSALAAMDPDLIAALRADGAADRIVALELARAAAPQLAVAVAAAFGRAIAEVGASLMVGGNLLGHTRILTTSIALEVSRGDFGLAIALGIILLAIAFLVNLLLGWRSRPWAY